MIKKSLKKRLFLIFSSLFIVLIVYLFPERSDSGVEIKSSSKDQSIIYLLDHNNYVSRVFVVIQDDSIIKKATEIINYLTINSKNANYIKEGFNPIIPKGTKLLSISVDKDLIKLNFSKHFFEVSEENEEKMLSAIIFSLTSIDGVKKISIYVEGNILNELPNSHKMLYPTLDRSYGINTIYDFSYIKGTTKTTVYYLSKYDDYYYYVPITMVNNNQNDKIEIIINELTSRSVYNTNLISYLKDARQMSYEVNDNYILINLRKDLYTDLNESNLLESVVYSINLSIKDNYKVSKVIYTTDKTIINSYNI